MKLIDRRYQNKGIRLLIIIFLTSGLAMFSCEKYNYEPPGIDSEKTYSFSVDVQPIFKKSCAGCHPVLSQPDLSEENAYESLFEGNYINTSVPEESSLLLKLENVHQGFDGSSPEYVEILGWITQGAENN
jgi:hypothetical protein